MKAGRIGRGVPPGSRVNAAGGDPARRTAWIAASAGFMLAAEFVQTVLPGSPADFGKLIADETVKWAKVIKFAGIKAD